jgi:signal transduction histidine kinase
VSSSADDPRRGFAAVGAGAFTDTRTMRVRLLAVHVVVFTFLSVLTTVIWAASDPGGHFWPEWVIWAFGIPLAGHLWVDALFFWPTLASRRGLSPSIVREVGLGAIACVAFTLIWVMTNDRSGFWPVWPIMVVVVLVTLRLGFTLVPQVRDSALAERISRLERTRRGAVDQQEDELRRIERDLHDGAQARIVALGMSLGMAEQKLADDPDAARALLSEARAGVREALAVLRDLARGIAPPVLADRGLEAAVSALVARSPLAVALEADVRRRPPRAVESAAYFVVAEALANVGKHARAEHVRVRLHEHGTRLVVQVTDDGVGGATATGSGLAGLRSRVEALDGSLELSSPLGGPTTLKAVLPCAS